MLNKRGLLISLLLLLLLSACAGNTTNTQTPGVPPSGADPGMETPAGGMMLDENAPAVVAAKTALSQQLGVAEDQISFVSAEAVQWTDSCLGLGGPAESCLQALTPGYSVMLSALETSYEVRTNEDGTAVRVNTN